jgi:hypothetical protein
MDGSLARMQAARLANTGVQPIRAAEPGLGMACGADSRKVLLAGAGYVAPVDFDVELARREHLALRKSPI